MSDLNDPAYEQVQWMLENKHGIFRRFFPRHKDSPLEHELQYIVRQIKYNPQRGSGGNDALTDKFLGHIDLVVYNPMATHPDWRVHILGMKPREIPCLYFKVESQVPTMDEIMRRLQKYHFQLGRVPKERIVLLSPPTPLAEDIRAQGFGVVECPLAAPPPMVVEDSGGDSESEGEDGTAV